MVLLVRLLRIQEFTWHQTNVCRFYYTAQGMDDFLLSVSGTHERESEVIVAIIHPFHLVVSINMRLLRRNNVRYDKS